MIPSSKLCRVTSRVMGWSVELQAQLKSVSLFAQETKKYYIWNGFYVFPLLPIYWKVYKGLKVTCKQRLRNTCSCDASDRTTWIWYCSSAPGCKQRNKTRRVSHLTGVHKVFREIHRLHITYVFLRGLFLHHYPYKGGCPPFLAILLYSREGCFVPVIACFLCAGTESYCLGTRFNLEFRLMATFKGDTECKVV